MSQIHLLFRVDIGFSEDRGYACSVFDVPNQRMKGIKANSIEQLASRLRNVILEEGRKKRNFPLESEPRSPIIMPESNDPLFKKV
jgi:hypothetical protein